MRIAIFGQQAFGKSVLEAFLDRGDEVAAVFCAPTKPGARPDPLAEAAQEGGIRLHQLPSLKGPEAAEALRTANVDIAVMAYVLQFAPQSLVNIPPHGTICYHPSLLPKYRGPSSINWPIIRGDTQTGLTIFRPSDGLDEGPVVLQKIVGIGPDDTLGSVYFNHLFPMGVAAMLEAADLVVAGKNREVVQDESHASYEGWCKDEEAHINWHQHVDAIYNLIRGCNPAPGAWTTWNGRTLRLFDARKIPVRKLSDVAGKPGEVVAVGERSVIVAAQGGSIELLKVRLDGGDKVAASVFATENGIMTGTRLGIAVEAAAKQSEPV
ncbi:methionyl-tRNA formyltransferase [Sphingobium nicotianae]|uniref:Methionyl-tRNA formyltransferase n=1 Tax=Sphingobium nicotianae TaxID=2782607 RepID=A0A9X1DBY6_9SPHN|nr:methionyl-tRNA formyltransferase [Sphingobium nicotianae]MBT2187192.1 methionyl-tRNA formyltransferase [Sphingobium nicotianae]